MAKRDLESQVADLTASIADLQARLDAVEARTAGVVAQRKPITHAEALKATMADRFVVLAPYAPLGVSTGDRFEVRQRVSTIAILASHVEAGLRLAAA